jgi:hypothetical protein
VWGSGVRVPSAPPRSEQRSRDGRDRIGVITRSDRGVQRIPKVIARILVEDDRHRGKALWRHRLAALLSGAAVTAFLVWGMTQTESAQRVHGRTTMSWWILELAITAVLVALAIWLGPFIKRYGRAYAADVFHDNPLTGKSYIILTDIVYYLIFTAYILFTVQFEPQQGWGLTGDVSAAQLDYDVKRVAGILIIIGVLHGINIIMLPVLGRLFALNRRLPAPTTLAPSQREAINRTD